MEEEQWEFENTKAAAIVIQVNLFLAFLHIGFSSRSSTAIMARTGHKSKSQGLHAPTKQGPATV